MLAATGRFRVCVTAALAVLGAAGSAAQQHAVDPNAPIIRGIQIIRHRIFDSAEATSIVYKGMNALHFTTREYVVREQLLFKEGDRWDTAVVSETARNLRSTGFFRNVTIDSLPTDSGVIARVTTQDAWTLGIVFSIQSAGSQINYAIGFNARNFLGTGTQFQMQYGKNADRDSVLFMLTKDFIFGTKYDFQVNYNALSDGNAGYLNFGLPFRTMQTPVGWNLYSDLYNGRVLQFVGGDTTAVDTLRRAYHVFSLNPAMAVSSGPEHYVRVGVYMQLQSSAYQPYGAPPAQLADSISGAFGPFITASYPNFKHVRYYLAGGRREDLQLGFTVTAGAYIAPAQWGYHKAGIGPWAVLTAGQTLSQVTVQESLTVTSLFNGSGLDSGTAYAGVTAWTQLAPTQLLIGYIGGGMQRNGFPGENWDLGLGYGVRAFPQHAFTGNRMFITAGEYRWFFAPNLARLFAVGIAAFVDHSGAWYDGSPIRTGTDAGIGLRFSSITGNPGYVMRADAAYRWANGVEPAGWVFTFGKGFVWQVF
jgi:hypothetical protein